MTSITLEKVAKRFGDTIALASIDLRIEAGEIFFLLGPSGCGKTTLLRAIAGFHQPDSGRILFGDEDVTRVPPHLRSTGMMFQSYALWPHLTVGQNVAFGLEERRVPADEIRRRVEDALASVQMAGLGDRRIHQLSGGQQQRVALARALVIRPRCLLLDEPLSNLDARLRLGMRAEIRRICREAKLTAIYVTHDQKEALSIADRMAILEGGRLQQVGTPAEVYRRPVNRLVADFMGETNFLEGRVTEVANGLVRIETPLGVLSAKAPSESPSGGSPSIAPAVGGAALLSIRPECWKLSAQSDLPNSIPGRIAERVYLGETAQYRFAAGTQELKIFELNPRFIEAPAEAQVFASVAPEDVVIVSPT